MGAHSSNFFKAPAKHESQQVESYTVIDTGGGQFQAAAVALIDYLNSGGVVDDKVLKKILDRFSQDFPQYINKEHLSTPKDYMSRLLATKRKSELVECMADVLRFLARDELFTHPLDLNYRKIFAQFDADTLKSHLRNPKVEFDEHIFKALEKALGLAITLSFKEPDKELGRQEKSSEFEHEALLIQIQEGRYYPAVKRQADFAFVGKVAVTAKPANDPVEQEGTLAEFKEAIKKADEELVKKFSHIKNKLLTMAKLGELTKEQLIHLYTTLLPRKLCDISFIIGLEHTAHPVIIDNAMRPEKFVMGLVDALAGWIAVGAVSEEQLFAEVEDKIPTPISAFS